MSDEVGMIDEDLLLLLLVFTLLGNIVIFLMEYLLLIALRTI